MLRPRLIPCLLIHNGALVKTVRFAEPKYVGDPLNAVRIFNEKEVDELIVLDIGATVQHQEPNHGLIEKLAAECRMPICYGGGVQTAEQVETIVSLGVEKVAMSAVAVRNPDVVAEAARRVGSQSVVVVIDVKKCGSDARYEVVTHNATRRTGVEPVDFARRLVELGVGEIVVNSVDRDGEMRGYDLDLVEAVRRVVNVPLTVLGGAGSLADVAALFQRFGTVGAAAGSLFVFKGKYRAVLINYPDRSAREALYAAALTR